MTNLGFDFSNNEFQPLAARMRPNDLSNYFGQSHLLAPGKPLRRAIEAGHVHSMILWGPPGTGKTTLAEIIAHRINADVERISAVTGGLRKFEMQLSAPSKIAWPVDKPFYLWMKCTVLIKASKMHFYRILKTVPLSLLVRRPKIRPLN